VAFADGVLHLTRSLVVACVFASLLAAPTKGAPQAVTPARRVQGGVVVLEHAADAFNRAPRLTLGASPLATMGGADADPAYDLTTASSVVLLRDGRLATFSLLGSRFLIFGADGKPERIIGRQGEGPGEFQSATGLVALGDTLFLADNSLRRFNWILPDRGVVRSRSAVHGFRLTARHVAGALPGGRLVMHSSGSVSPPDTGTRTLTPIVITTVDDGPARTIAKIPDLDLQQIETRYRGRIRTSTTALRFSRLARVVVWDTLIATSGSRSEIDLRNAQGKIVSRLNAPFARRPVTRAMRDLVIAAELTRLDGPQAERMVDPDENRRLAREMPFADSLPPYMGLFVTPNRTLWVVDATAPGDTAWSATAFRLDGAIVGRLHAARSGKPVYFGNDRVVVREEDDDGVVSMKVFQIITSSSSPASSRPLRFSPAAPPQ